MRNLTKEEIEKIPLLKKEGYTTRGIARLYSVHTTAINYWIRRLDQDYSIKVPKDKMGRPKLVLYMDPTHTKVVVELETATHQSESHGK